MVRKKAKKKKVSRKRASAKRPEKAAGKKTTKKRPAAKRAGKAFRTAAKKMRKSAKKTAARKAPRKAAVRKKSPVKSPMRKQAAARKKKSVKPARKPVTFRKKSAIPPSEIATATLGFEEIVAQVSEGQAEEARIEGSKFDIGVPSNAHAMPLQEIPQGYDKNQVMLLVVDPRFVFTYWEVRHDTMTDAQNRFGHRGKLTLRFYDITNTGNPENSPSWDVEVFDRLGNWYLRLERPEQRLCLDVGIKGPSGEFWRVARSNILRLPPQSLAAPGPIKWMVVTPGGETLISDTEDYTDADLELLKKILGPYFFDLLMRGRFASIAGSSVEAIFYDVEALRTMPPPGESPSSPLAWAK